MGVNARPDLLLMRLEWKMPAEEQKVALDKLQEQYAEDVLGGLPTEEDGQRLLRLARRNLDRFADQSADASESEVGS